MKDISRLEAIRQATAQALQNYQARRAALAAEGSRPAQPGDVYLFPISSAIDLSWVVIGHHPEQELLFALPADGHPLVGLTDVEVSDAASLGPLVLRCGYGLWIHRDEFRPEFRVGLLEERYLHRAREKLGQMTAGKLQGTAAHWESEANPDYDDWLAEVSRVADTLASALRLREETLTAADFGPALKLPGPEPTPADAEPQLALAASSGGPLARLYEALQLEAKEGPPARPVPLLYPGAVYLLLEAQGVAVVYLLESATPPPELRALDAAGHARAAEWMSTPRGTAMRAFFPWEQGKVRLRFGGGEQVRDVVIQQ